MEFLQEFFLYEKRTRIKCCLTWCLFFLTTSNVRYNLMFFEALSPLNTMKDEKDSIITAWASFYDNKAIAFGIGSEKEAEHAIYTASVNEKYASREFKQSQAERMIYDNFTKLYGEPEPITKEIAMFRIMLAEKMEKGMVLQSEADYLLAKKESEISERLKEIQAREEQKMEEEATRRALLELQQKQLINQQQANVIAQRQAQSQALMRFANFLSQQTYQQQLIRSLNKPFSMTCFSQGNYTYCQ